MPTEDPALGLVKHSHTRRPSTGPTYTHTHTHPHTHTHRHTLYSFYCNARLSRFTNKILILSSFTHVCKHRGECQHIQPTPFSHILSPPLSHTQSHAPILPGHCLIVCHMHYQTMYNMKHQQQYVHSTLLTIIQGTYIFCTAVNTQIHYASTQILLKRLVA